MAGAATPIVRDSTPSSAADALAAQIVSEDPDAASALVQALERLLTHRPLDRLERVWGLSSAQAAALFGVSRQAYAKWRTSGIPAERRSDVADLDRATQCLVDHVRVDRIPAIVRRPSADLDGATWLDLARRDRRAAREVIERTFDLHRVQP